MIGRKAIAGMKVAQKKGEPAVKFAAGARVLPGGPNGVGTGYLNNAVGKIKKGMAARRKAEAEIMKDL
jgi:hypothetical protein